MSHHQLAWLAAALALYAANAPAQVLLDRAAQKQQIQQMLEEEKTANNVYEAHFPNLNMGRKAAITFHNELLESNYAAGYLVLELTPQDLLKLRSFGFKVKPATQFMRQRKQFIEQLQNTVSQASGQDAPGAKVGTFAIPGYSCYETVEETFAAAEGLATAHPTLASWTAVGQSWEKTAGIGGYDIKVLKLTNTEIAEPKPKLFVNSAIHAREYTTAPMALEFARWLVNGWGTNADATWILDHHEVHLMLHTNPDGRKKAEAGLSWRKNTNRNFCSASSNSRGVDLNRNFSFSWNSTRGEGSSGSQCNLTYRGPNAGSEPETEAIQSYVRAIWSDLRGPSDNDAAPDTTSGIHIDLHSYSELVLWPWGTTSEKAPNGPALQTLGRKLAFFNDYTPQQSVGLYPTDGTSDSVSYGELGVPAFTIEMGTSFFQGCSTYNNTIKPKNLQALIYAAKVVRTPYITPGGPDVTTMALSQDAATAGVQTGTQVNLSALASDTRFNNSNGIESTQRIAAAEYYIDVPPWAADAQPVSLNANDGSYDANSESVTGIVDTSGLTIGKHIVFVRARDISGTWGPVTASFIVVNAN